MKDRNVTNQSPSYTDFLRAKAAIAPKFGGITLNEATLNPALKPHTRRMVAWGLGGGRRAWFANFGWLQPEPAGPDRPVFY